MSKLDTFEILWMWIHPLLENTNITISLSDHTYSVPGQHLSGLHEYHLLPRPKNYARCRDRL